MSVRIPVDEWCRTCEDAWLEDLLRRRAASSDLWEQATAAGLYARFFDVAATDSALQPAVSWLTRQVGLGVEAARRWARNLSTAERDTLIAGTVDRVGQLSKMLEKLDRAIKLDDAAWLAEVKTVCHGRDDVEAVRWVIEAAGGRLTSHSGLEELDAQGRELFSALPGTLLRDDERMRRAREVDPEAWWVLPATPDDWVREVIAAAALVAPARRPPVIVHEVDRLAGLSPAVAWLAAADKAQPTYEVYSSIGDVEVSAVAVDDGWIVTVTRRGRPVPGAIVHLEVMRGDEAVRVVGVGLTDRNGEAEFGPRVRFPTPKQGERYRWVILPPDQLVSTAVTGT